MVRRHSIKGPEEKKDNTNQFILITAGALIILVFVLWIFFGYKYIWIPAEKLLQAI